jgi:hypothetical protein
MSYPEPAGDSSLLPSSRVLELGIKTLLSEWQWLVIRSLRRMEIRQMKKRLDQEYLVLGKLESQDGQDARERIELSRRQIAFLNQEIALLESELDKTRQEYIAKRIEKWRVD